MRAIPKGHVDSREEMMNGAHPVESHPTSLYAVETSHDAPSELVGLQSMILILIGAHRQAPKARNRWRENQHGLISILHSNEEWSGGWLEYIVEFSETQRAESWLHLYSPEVPAGK